MAPITIPVGDKQLDVPEQLSLDQGIIISEIVSGLLRRYPHIIEEYQAWRSEFPRTHRLVIRATTYEAAEADNKQIIKDTLAAYGKTIDDLREEGEMDFPMEPEGQDLAIFLGPLVVELALPALLKVVGTIITDEDALFTASERGPDAVEDLVADAVRRVRKAARPADLLGMAIAVVEVVVREFEVLSDAGKLQALVERFQKAGTQPTPDNGQPLTSVPALSDERTTSSS